MQSGWRTDSSGWASLPVTNWVAPNCAMFAITLLSSSLTSVDSVPVRPGLFYQCPDWCFVAYGLQHRVPGRSPQISMWTFSAQPGHLPYLLNHRASLCCANSPACLPADREAKPYMTFLSPGSSPGQALGSQICSPVSFRRNLAAAPLPSANG